MSGDKLHVIDRCLRDSRLMAVYDAGLRKRAFEHLARAKRFILTDNASTRFGEILKDAEALMLGNTQFSIPPFDDCYFELNVDLAYAACKKDIARLGDPGDTDNRVGFLVHKHRDGSYDVITFSLTRQDECAAGPFSYHRFSHKPSCSLQLFIDMVRRQDGRVVNIARQQHESMQEWAKLALMLGTGLGEIPSEEARKQIAHEWTMQPAFDKRHWPYRSAVNYTCSVGDVRNLVCLLLLLNQPMLYSATSVGHSHGLYKGKRQVYAAHSLIEITLGQRKQARRILTHMGPRKPPIRHEVRGHFAHWRLKEGCTHDWPMLPAIEEDAVPRWTCKRCGGLRVWREHFVRGSAEEGWSDHEYRLT